PARREKRETGEIYAIEEEVRKAKYREIVKQKKLTLVVVVSSGGLNQQVTQENAGETRRSSRRCRFTIASRPTSLHTHTHQLQLQQQQQQQPASQLLVDSCNSFCSFIKRPSSST
ncbi:conserved hypothetical protein, partial [Trichinella spiralis]|uniref:hypothetical protein n=1 Tax=Trichinella spiralis TaxID=6334 RepID=UPI0001EFDCE7